MTAPFISMDVTFADNARPIRLFILDDHAIVRVGLKNRIGTQSDIEVASEAGSVRLALTGILALQQQPLQGSDGFVSTTALVAQMATALIS